MFLGRSSPAIAGRALVKGHLGQSQAGAPCPAPGVQLLSARPWSYPVAPVAHEAAPGAAGPGESGRGHDTSPVGQCSLWGMIEGHWQGWGLSPGWVLNIVKGGFGGCCRGRGQRVAPLPILGPSHPPRLFVCPP